tara:strand:+ start:231 stop:677 length:447 start_codon:yes stop_codon:yes gene_type:complete
MLKLLTLIFFILIFKFDSIAVEKEYFLMLKYNKVNVRFGPSRDDQIKFIYSKKNLPLKVIDKKENFRKIIDHKKNSGWIHISQLKSVKSLIILENKIIYKKNTRYSKPIAELEQGKLVLIRKCKLNWCKVDANQFTGWLNTDNVWGIN